MIPGLDSHIMRWYCIRTHSLPSTDEMIVKYGFSCWTWNTIYLISDVIHKSYKNTNFNNIKKNWAIFDFFCFVQALFEVITNSVFDHDYRVESFTWTLSPVRALKNRACWNKCHIWQNRSKRSPKLQHPGRAVEKWSDYDQREKFIRR